MLDHLGNWSRSHYCGVLREKNIGESVCLMGWVQKERDLGSLIFVDLRDFSGIVQLVFNNDTDSALYETAQGLRSEFVIAVKGKPRERSNKNPNIPTGNIEVLVDELKILNTSEVPPIYVKDGDNVDETMRLKYRTLDLRKPEMQRNLRLRSKISQLTRNFFIDHNFVEIETPMLTKPTPEGARDYLVPSRINKGKFYALPQSPQLMKQLLMVGGFDRYIQITKCFRDEDLRANRQPEFTQIDMEMSFMSREEIMDLNEEFIQMLYREIKGVELSRPFKKLPYNEAMDRFGSDKPDLRFAMEIQNISQLVKDSSFKVFSEATKDGKSVRCLLAKGLGKDLSRKKIDKLEDFVKTYGAKGLAWIKINKDGIQSPIAKFLDKELDAIIESLEAEVGDIILIVADEDSTVLAALGALRLHLAREFNLIDENHDEILWITDFPQFEYSQEENRYVAMHHPFTHPLEEDIPKLEEDPSEVRAKAYDLVINGDEVGGGSIRINNSDLQEKMFKALGFSKEDAEEKFGFLLDAFKYGAPPHGGIAYGLDRLTMIFTGADNIRDVIAFPKTQSATCLMTGAPVEVSDKQLDELNIEVK
ncbi:aspartate--tRNA ligase [Urinicoccus massiliensis]|uniref:aspartate--tRNA ligase n=1 Tax=Urinicoccus massiliensis TaxID=1723382 RepID=UPI00092FDF9D|nr:aspartate--tRNA ligase [Urinicoccus massiliensis]